MKKSLSGAMAILLMAVSCQTEKIEQATEYGTIDVAICGEPSYDVVVKASETLSAAAAAYYNISIYDDSDVCQYGPVKYASFESKVLPMGTYYVTAESCTETEAEVGNGTRRFAGKSADITLTPSAISQTATVDCVVTNARVAVAFDPSVSGNFTDLMVYVAGGTTSGRKVVINESSSDTELWFNPSAISYTISGTFKPTGKVLTLTGTRTLAAKDDVRILVKLNLENGEIAAFPTITVDVSMNQQTPVEEEFNPYEK